MKAELKSICELVRACGLFIKDIDRSHLHVDEKSGHADLVTQYDKQVQERLRTGLLEIMPDAHFVGEEGTTQTFAPVGKFFIVDPIDGTTNFVKGYNFSSISVALVVEGYNFSSISVALVVDNAAELGVVYNPYADEMFWAQRGQGAFCNGKPLHVSNEPLENGIVMFGTAPYHEELSEKTFQLAYDYFKKALDIRRSGSAALDLCTVAAGRAELFFELFLSPWDFAAGALIVTEAGGLVTDCDGRPLVYDRPCSVLAHNQLAIPF